ncbi:hypothetical protein ABIE45_004509 [Methylobacterium sp. OAE515]|uniref:hypothetical protein n=1 Tax=Methylobacterium sp. OAE515 TaxID=2817895 RepID=UPI0017890B90
MDKLQDRSPLIAVEFYLVQDFAKGEERLARQDGAYKVYPPDTLLPVMKTLKIKLTKEIDEPGVLREFVFSFEFARGTDLSHRWPPFPEKVN